MPKQIPELKRYPVSAKDPLQAWDSADELMLAHLKELPLSGKRILILNDLFGALSCGLIDQEVTTYTDSFVSAEGIRLNSEGSVKPLHALEDLSGVYDYVLLKLPKNLSFLEDQLCRVSAHVQAGSKLIAAAMVKHLPTGAFDLIQKYFGETTTSLAQKKARLIFADFERKAIASPYPLKVKIENFEQAFVNHSNVFSREKLDIGTRFFLEHLPQGPFETILDLGCANGIVGIAAKKRNPGAHLIFSDDSAMALQSARANYQNYFSDEAELVWTNCYESGAKDSLDLVLCNPPFHQQQTIGDFIAWQMFLDAHRTLKPGGKLRVIGNSHLGYQAKLKKIFGNSERVATNSKFQIIEAVKTHS